MSKSVTPTTLANAIRALSMDAIEQANSGHPGAPMGMADIAEVLWNDFLKHNPQNPHWPDRDRFVLSNGHGSMLLYALLHLSGYDLSINDIKQFRQFHSKTPGHPEYGYTPGVETTTGPLGQGLANAVGMAIAEKNLAATFNHESIAVVDHYTYCFVGDGCLMEGISHEVCSLAGTLSLGKLIVFYDDNGISIDGQVDGWFTDQTDIRFRAYDWQVIGPIDGHDRNQIHAAIIDAQQCSDKPTLIICKTIIGKGSPNKGGTAGAHGSPLGAQESALTREALDWPYEPFMIPDSVYKAWDAKTRGQLAESSWNEQLKRLHEVDPDKAQAFHRRVIAAELPPAFGAKAKAFTKQLQAAAETMASRKASQQCLAYFGAILPELLGGSADLAPSNLTLWSESKAITASQPGNYLHYGVREFGMSAIMNGIALHRGFIPYGATFLVFTEYARNAVRMAALMKQRCIFIYTHDSIGLGEDGPTHQPIEQLASLRQTPHLMTWRPCDTVESAVAWQHAIEYKGPSALIFSRQSLTCQQRGDDQLNAISRGGYVLQDSATTPELILIATGSEVELAIQAANKLTERNIAVRVVSMPCTERFDAQDVQYKASVLPPTITRRIAIEAAISDYWLKYVGLHGRTIGIDTFGESAPADRLFSHFGLTVERIMQQAEALLAN